MFSQSQTSTIQLVHCPVFDIKIPTDNGTFLSQVPNYFFLLAELIFLLAELIFLLAEW